MPIHILHDASISPALLNGWIRSFMSAVKVLIAAFEGILEERIFIKS